MPDRQLVGIAEIVRPDDRAGRDLVLLGQLDDRVAGLDDVRDHARARPQRGQRLLVGRREERRLAGVARRARERRRAVGGVLDRELLEGLVDGPLGRADRRADRHPDRQGEDERVRGQAGRHAHQGRVPEGDADPVSQPLCPRPAI